MDLALGKTAGRIPLRRRTKGRSHHGIRESDRMVVVTGRSDLADAYKPLATQVASGTSGGCRLGIPVSAVATGQEALVLFLYDSGGSIHDDRTGSRAARITRARASAEDSGESFLDRWGRSPPPLLLSDHRRSRTSAQLVAKQNVVRKLDLATYH